MFACEPFSGAPKTDVNLVENQQDLVFVAKFAKQRQKVFWRNVNATANLNGFNKNRPRFSAAQNLADRFFKRLRLAFMRRKRNELPELAKLGTKRATKMFSMRRVQGAVAQPESE